MAENRRAESADWMEAVEREEYSLASYLRENRNPSGAFIFGRREGHAAGPAESNGILVPAGILSKL